jgi:hypothetical protein
LFAHDAQSSKDFSWNPISCDDVSVVAQPTDLSLNEQRPDSLCGIAEQRLTVGCHSVVFRPIGKVGQGLLDLATLTAKRIGPSGGEFIFQWAERRI